MPTYIRKTARYNGKKYEATGKTEREAMTKLADKLAAAKRGEETFGGDMTVDAWYHRWLDLYKAPKGLTHKSLGMYNEKYEGYIKPRVGMMKLKDVRDVHLQAILNAQAGKSYSHVDKLRRVMREMFSRARKSRFILYDPAEDLELPKAQDGRRRSITEQERATILAVSQTHPAGLWILTLLYTGMRPAETAALTWADVDFKHNEIHVHASLESGSKTIKEPKTEAGIRDIPIHAALRPRLLDASKGQPPFSPVFPTATGGRQNSGSLYRKWQSFRRAMNLHLGAKVYRNQLKEDLVAKDLTPYCLRHTFCTDLEAAGVPLNVAKDLMGHADISVTANIYTHKNKSIMHTSMALLDGTGGNSGGIIR